MNSAVRGARPLLGRIRRAAQSLLGQAHDAVRHRSMLRAPVSPGAGPHVFYGRDHVPRFDEPAHGGLVKVQHLDGVFPNAPRAFDVLYLVSSALPRDADALAEVARRRGAALVWNQNGVTYPGLTPEYEAVNRRFREPLETAAHVFFQSAFCKLSAERFVGAPTGTWEVLPNPVDTERFVAGRRPDRPLTLLLGGNQYQRYRFETALQTLGFVLREVPDTRLLVTGTLSWNADRRIAQREGLELLREQGLIEHVDMVGTYTQAEAPAVMRRGDLLLHTKYNDPCPTIVLEAMASGLPVVYSASGGTPELVGEDAGIGIPAPLDFDRDHPPAPEALAAAVLAVSARLAEHAEAARRRAVEHFDVRPWLERHRVVFERLAA